MQKLKIKVDLRTQSGVAEDSAPKVYKNEQDRQSGFEDKCQQYIDKFHKLNIENGLVLKQEKDKLAEIFKNQQEMLDKKLKDGFVGM